MRSVLILRSLSLSLPLLLPRRWPLEQFCMVSCLSSWRKSNAWHLLLKNVAKSMFYDPFWLRAHYGFGRPFLQSVFENCYVPWKLTAKTQAKLQRKIESDREFERRIERERGGGVSRKMRSRTQMQRIVYFNNKIKQRRTKTTPKGKNKQAGRHKTGAQSTWNTHDVRHTKDNGSAQDCRHKETI